MIGRAVVLFAVLTLLFAAGEHFWPSAPEPLVLVCMAAGAVAWEMFRAAWSWLFGTPSDREM